MVVGAEGDGRVEEMVHAAVDADWRVVAGTEERLAVDTICVGYGFVTSTELLRLAGCQFGYDEDLGGAVVEVDEFQRTSVPGCWRPATAPEYAVRRWRPTRDGWPLLVPRSNLGSLSPRPQGDALAQPVRRRLAAKEDSPAALGPYYRVGPGVGELATATTVVCRCRGGDHGQAGGSGRGGYATWPELYPGRDGPVPGRGLPAPGGAPCLGPPERALGLRTWPP